MVQKQVWSPQGRPCSRGENMGLYVGIKTPRIPEKVLGVESSKNPNGTSSELDPLLINISHFYVIYVIQLAG